MTNHIMSDKEMEASISLLYMMQPMDISGAASSCKIVPENRDVPHDSLMKVVSIQEPDKLSRPRIAAQKKVQQRGARLTALSRELTLEQLRPHFCRPIVEVAREFGICTTFLKKICRRCGIKRWPHRQIRSLNRTIQMLEQVKSLATNSIDEARYVKQIDELKEKQRAVMEDPDTNGKLKRMKRFPTLKGATDPVSMDNDQISGALPQPLTVLPPDSADATNCADATSLSALAVAVDTVSTGTIAETNASKDSNSSRGSFAINVQISSSPTPTPSSLTTPLHSAVPIRMPLEIKISPSNRKLILAKRHLKDRP